MSHIAAMYRKIQIDATVRKLQESGVVLTPALLSQIEDDVEAKMAEITDGSEHIEDKESDD